MTELVPADDQPRRRIAPKVFADVPSQDELDAVRKSRSRLAVWIVLLLGMLIASLVALGFLVADRRQVTDLTILVQELGQERSDVIALLAVDEDPDIGRLDDAVSAWAQDQTDQIEELEDDIADLAELGEYETIHNRRVRAAELRADIAQLLELPARRTVPDRIDLDTYEESFPPWKEELEAELLAYVNGLEAERQAILDWEPLRPGELDERPPEPRLP